MGCDRREDGWMDVEDELTAGFRALEEALWTSETRGDPQWFDMILAPNFSEHGKSGRVYDRQTIPREVPPVIDVDLPLADFAARAISETVVLVTYTSNQGARTTNRASVWSHDGTSWRLEFHSGTPADPLTARDVAPGGFDVARRGYDPSQVDAFVASLQARV